MRRVIACMIILSAASGCGNDFPSFFPKPPEVWKCTYSWRFQKFRCKNSVTSAVENRRLDDSRMEAAEALPQDDYLEGEDWLDEVAKTARQRCR